MRSGRDYGAIEYRWCFSDVEMVPIEGCRAEVWLYKSTRAGSINPKKETLMQDLSKEAQNVSTESRVKCRVGM